MASTTKILQAVNEAYMDLAEMQSLLPDNLIIEFRQGSASAVNADTGQSKAIYPRPTLTDPKTQDKSGKLPFPLNFFFKFMKYFSKFMKC